MQKKNYYWLAAGILLIAANLRMPITMMPPIIPWLKSSLGFPTSMSGLLTTIPLIMFALISPTIANLGAKKGNAPVLLGTLVILVSGCILRILPNNWTLIGATVLIGIGISGGNVLLPAVIQEYFPRKTALLTSLYTFTMGVVASIGTGLAAPLTQATNLPTALFILSIFSLLELLVWIKAAHGIPVVRSVSRSKKSNNNSRYLLKYPLTWFITYCFGAQSLLYYSLVTWLPVYWTSTGFSTTTSGVLATVFQLCGMPISLLTPMIARKRSGMYFINSLVGGGFSLGLVLLIICKGNFAMNVLLSLLMGMASAAAFSMCVIFFQKKTSSIIQVAQMSGIAQSVGYLLAACGPILSGLINKALGSWTPIFIIYIMIAVLMWMAAIVTTHHQPLKDSNPKS